MDLPTRIMRAVNEWYMRNQPNASYTWFDYNKRLEYRITRNDQSEYFKILDALEGQDGTDKR